MSILETPATRHTKNGRTDSGICSFYLGKKVAFVYRGTKEIRGSKIRVIWGKVTRPHGTYFPSSNSALKPLGAEFWSHSRTGLTFDCR